MQGLVVMVMIACADTAEIAPPEPPEPTLAIAPPWRVEKQTSHEVVLRLGDSAHGARVTLAPGERGRVPGVTPIVGGRTLEVADDGESWPLVAVPWPDRPLSAAAIEVDGVDLVVRLAGPPLAEVGDHPSAPRDPALTWVRLRHRGEDWRIVVTGLATVSLPGGTTAEPAPDGTVTVRSSWGRLDFASDAPRHSGSADPERWWWTNRPSVDAAAPYERTSFTFTPSRPQR